MTTYPWAILLVLFVAAFSKSATADPPPAQLPSQFVLHKSRGDLARAAGRLTEAQENYEKALALRYDPLVAGRLGLVRLGLRDFDSAAGFLYQAAHDTSASLSPYDRVTFFQALSVARREVCRVDIKVDQADEELAIEIDDVVRSKGRSVFWLFLKPGTHTIRAKLEGFQDAVETVITERGCEGNAVVELHLEPVSPPSRVVTMAFAEQLETLREQSSALIEKSKSSVDVWPLYSAKLPPNPLKPSVIGGFVLGAGVWIPFGMTPGLGIDMGVGGQLHAGWRSGSWWEIGVDGRLAWSLEEKPKFSAGSVHTWAIALAPCGRSRANFFGCVLLQVDGGAFGTAVRWQLGALGARAGYEFHLTERVYLRAFVDILGHFGTPDLRIEGAPLWGGFLLTPTVGMSALRFF